MKSANVGMEVRDFRHEEVLGEVLKVVAQARKVLCVIHAGPDGDAVGSSLGLGLALQDAGREVFFFCATEVPYNLRFLPGMELVQRSIPEDLHFDATFICDAAASGRVGPGLPGPERRGVFVNLDHHMSNDCFGDVNYVDPGAAAVGVMVLRVIEGAGLPLNKPAATALYTSVLTDTGSFRYSSTNPEALEAAARMVAAGCEPWEVSSAVYEEQPVERLLLLQRVLGSLELSNDGKLASMVLRWADLEAVGASADLSDGFINFARSIRGVEVAALLSEPKPGGDGLWRLSFRSRGKVNVAAVAAHFGGGGHFNAAGASLAGTLPEVRQKIAEALSEGLRSVVSEGG